MHNARIRELLLQSLEHERGGIQIYQTALRCVVNADLRKQWEKYLLQTREHERILAETCQAIRLDGETETPGRGVVRGMWKSLVQAMDLALQAHEAEAAELVACECVVLAETKDHANWELIGKCAAKLSGIAAMALQQAYDQVEPQEDEHLYYTKGWCRELWLKSLGLRALLPPEEVRKVTTAIGAARAALQASAR